MPTPCNDPPGPQVRNNDIVSAYMKVMRTILTVIYRVGRTIITVIVYIIVAIFTWIMYIAPVLLPFLIAGVIIYFVVSIAWDTGARPIFSLIYAAINFMIKLWNSIVRALRKLGVRMPTADEVAGDLPTFWQFLKWILYSIVIIPIKAATKGLIIRE